MEEDAKERSQLGAIERSSTELRLAAEAVFFDFFAPPLNPMVVFLSSSAAIDT